MSENRILRAQLRDAQIAQDVAERQVASAIEMLMERREQIETLEAQITRLKEALGLFVDREDPYGPTWPDCHCVDVVRHGLALGDLRRARAALLEPMAKGPPD